VGEWGTSSNIQKKPEKGERALCPEEKKENRPAGGNQGGFWGGVPLHKPKKGNQRRSPVEKRENSKSKELKKPAWKSTRARKPQKRREKKRPKRRPLGVPEGKGPSLLTNPPRGDGGERLEKKKWKTGRTNCFFWRTGCRTTQKREGGKGARGPKPRKPRTTMLSKTEHLPKALVGGKGKTQKIVQEKGGVQNFWGITEKNRVESYLGKHRDSSKKVTNGRRGSRALSFVKNYTEGEKKGLKSAPF